MTPTDPRPLATLLEALVLALWLGAAIFFAAAVAPSAFAALPSRTLAGAVVGRVLPILFVVGMIAGAVVLGLELAARGAGGWGRGVAAAIMVASCAVAQFVIDARIERVRAEIPGALEALAPGDPRRAAFGRLHAFSVGWLAIAMIAAAVALVLAGRLLAVRR